MKLITVLKILNDKSRLRIINILKDNSLCVGEIQTILMIQQSNTSRHLAKLKSNNIIIFTKDAQRIFYTLNQAIFKEFAFLKKLLFEDMITENVFVQDEHKLQMYLDSDLSCEDLRFANFNFNQLNI